jgi:hypothetical protein
MGDIIVLSNSAFVEAMAMRMALDIALDQPLLMLLAMQCLWLCHCFAIAYPLI